MPRERRSPQKLQNRPTSTPFGEAGWVPARALGRAGARLEGQKSTFSNSPETPFQGPIPRLGSLLGVLATFDSPGERFGPPEVVPPGPPERPFSALLGPTENGPRKIARPITPRRPNRSRKLKKQRCEIEHAQHAQRVRRARATHFPLQRADLWPKRALLGSIFGWARS